MRILLIGEYSRLHNSLKEGLLALGHEVVIVGSGDGFKGFPVDIPLEIGFQSGIKKKLRLAILKLSGIDIAEVVFRRKFERLKNDVAGYDIVQLINETSFGASPELEMKIISFLKEHNKKLFLLSCGTDYTSVEHAFSEELPYSIATPYQEEKINPKEFAPILKYLNDDHKYHSRELHKLVNGIIATDLDYHIPLQGNEKYLGLIPNPINTDKISYKEISNLEPITIFHGINRHNYYKKGNDVFEEALISINKKYQRNVTIITVESLPYDEYIKTYNSAHIILDQIYSHDQGYNALEAMAAGKVVFTGAGIHFKNNYNLTKTVCIDATPNVDHLIEELSKLIENPQLIVEIGKNARAFIEQEHHYKTIAQRYIQTWNQAE